MDWENLNHYQVLQVSINADDFIIKAAYRALIQKYHPDKYEPKVEAERISRVINCAYEVLSNPDRRRVYDKSLDPSNTTRRSPSSKKAAQPNPVPANAKPPIKKSSNVWVWILLIIMTSISGRIIGIYSFIVSIVVIITWEMTSKMTTIPRILSSVTASVIAFIGCFIIVSGLSDNMMRLPEAASSKQTTTIRQDLGQKSTQTVQSAREVTIQDTKKQKEKEKENFQKQPKLNNFAEEEFAFNAVKAGIESRAIEENSLVSSDNYSFTIEANSNGYKLYSKEAGTIYLGKSCDALSRAFGVGYWFWSNGGLSIKLEEKQFFFPRQSVNDDICPDPN